MRRRDLMLGALAGSVPIAGWSGIRPAVLELFTSQGCSSCPPADALLGILERQPGVIALAWHVDYWNRLGWRDPFATRLATDRQYAYTARLAAEVFTPAMVVNGAAVVVGSDRGAITRAIRRVPPLRVPVSVRAAAGGLVVTFDPGAGVATALLVTYDPERETAIGAGENTGRRLREHHVVRTVTAAPPAAVAAGRAVFPTVQPGQGAAVLLQAADLRMVGAAAAGG